MTASVFTYGTLMFDPVWELVAGRAHEHTTALLRGYVRRAAKGRVYPVIHPGPAEPPILGRLYLGVSPAELSRLDAFEGDEYERRLVEVEASPDTPRVEAWVYVLATEHQSLAEQKPWDPFAFASRDLAAYVEHHERTFVPPRSR